MDSQSQPPRRSRPAPDPDYTTEVFVAPVVKPIVLTPPVEANPPPAPVELAKPTQSIAAAANDTAPMRVVVTDIHMSFGSMVTFLVKLAFAIIPAALIIAGLIAFFGVVVGGLGRLK